MLLDQARLGAHALLVRLLVDNLERLEHRLDARRAQLGVGLGVVVLARAEAERVVSLEVERRGALAGQRAERRGRRLLFGTRLRSGFLGRRGGLFLCEQGVTFGLLAS